MDAASWGPVPELPPVPFEHATTKAPRRAGIEAFLTSDMIPPARRWRLEGLAITCRKIPVLWAAPAQA
jgi:hypothetical protein